MPCKSVSRHDVIADEQYVAILRDEEKEHAVHESEELAVVVDRLKGSVLERVLEVSVGRVGQKSTSECGDRLLDALSECLQGTGPLCRRLLAPALEPATVRVLPLDPRLMTGEP